MGVRRTPRDTGDAIVAIEQRVQRLELRGRGYSIDSLIAGISTYIQPEAPTGGEYHEGDLWFDSDDGNKIYRWNGTSWVAVLGTTNDRVRDEAAAALVSAQDDAATVDGVVTSYVQATAPTLHDLGDLWIDTDDNMLYRWSGSAWVSTGNTEIGEKVTKEQNQISYADGRIITRWQFNEPTALGFGDLWIDTNAGNQLYRWNNLDWIKVLDWSLALLEEEVNTKISTYRQGSPPVAKAIGDIWINTSDGEKQYRWDGTDWIPVQDEAIGDAQDAADEAQDAADEAQDTADEAAHGVTIKSAIYYQPEPPELPLDMNDNPIPHDAGDLWFDTDDENHPYVWDPEANGGDGDWVDARDELATTAYGQALAAIAEAEAAMDYAETKNTTYRQDEEPTAPTAGFTEGDLWFDTDDGNQPYVWDGDAEEWVTVQDASAADAAEAAEAAQEAAAAATEAAADAIEASGSKSAVFYQDAAPTGGTYRTNDLWFDTNDGNKQYRWDGSAWVAAVGSYLQTPNTKLLINPAGLVTYDSGGTPTFSLTSATGAIAMTGAILTGGTITGPTLQTTSLVNRGVKMDTTGIYGYNSSGVTTFSLSASTGLMTANNGSFSGFIDGSIITGGTIQSESTTFRGIKMNSSGFTAYNSSGVPTFTITASSGAVAMQGSLTSGSTISGATITGGSVTGAIIQTSASDPRVVMRSAANPFESGSNWGLIEFYNQFGWSPGLLWATGTSTIGQIRMSGPYTGSYTNAPAITMQYNQSTGQRLMSLYAGTIDMAAAKYTFTSNDASSVDFRIGNSGGIFQLFDNPLTYGGWRFGWIAGTNFAHQIEARDGSASKTALELSGTHVYLNIGVGSGQRSLWVRKSTTAGPVVVIGRADDFPSVSFDSDAVKITSWDHTAYAVIKAFAFTVASDTRQKSNPTKVEGALDALMQIPVYDYDTPHGVPRRSSEMAELRKSENEHLWSSITFRTRGVMAQDVSQAVPLAALEDDVNDVSEGGGFSVDTYALLSTTIAAVQELAAQVEDLRAQKNDS